MKNAISKKAVGMAVALTGMAAVASAGRPPTPAAVPPVATAAVGGRFITTLPIDGGKVTINLDRPFSPLLLRFNGQRLSLIKHLGPVIRIKHHTFMPGRYRLRLFRSSVDVRARRVYAMYRILGISSPTYYWMTFAMTGPFIKIDLGLSEPIASEVEPGRLARPAAFKPFTVTTRIREAWPGNVVQAGFWNRRGHFWLYGQWNWERSNSVNGAQVGLKARHWRRNIAPPAKYPPFAFGLRRLVREQLVVGVSTNLWKAVGPLPNQPSQYGPQLAKSMFVDLWDYNYKNNQVFLKRLGREVAGTIRFYTIIQTWQYGGFDYANPDAYWPPKYPPCTDKIYGNLRDLRGLIATAKRFGWVGLRDNYLFIGHHAGPSYKAGLFKESMARPVPPGWPPMDLALHRLRYARGKGRSSFSDWSRLARFQETDIANSFGTDAEFVDQLGSTGPAYSVEPPWSIGAGVGRFLIYTERHFARLEVRLHHGPLSSETLLNTPLLGRWIATGDYGVFDGANRLLTPAYKLHELQRLSAFAGMGLGYRFFTFPRAGWLGYGSARYFGTPAHPYRGIDAYNAMTVLWGNGAYYFCYPLQAYNRDEPFTIAMTIGVLQRYYDLVPVRRILYRWHDRWQTLNDLMRDADIHFEPAQDNCPAFKVIRVEYSNGLVVTVNRGQTPFVVRAGGTPLTLPKNGWVGAMPNGSVLVYSAVGPLATRRIDFSFDKRRGIRFINPRGQTVEGVTGATLWLHGKKR